VFLRFRSRRRVPRRSRRRRRCGRRARGPRRTGARTRSRRGLGVIEHGPAGRPAISPRGKTTASPPPHTDRFGPAARPTRTGRCIVPTPGTVPRKRRDHTHCSRESREEMATGTHLDIANGQPETAARVSGEPLDHGRVPSSAVVRRTRGSARELAPSSTTTLSRRQIAPRSDGPPTSRCWRVIFFDPMGSRERP